MNILNFQPGPTMCNLKIFKEILMSLSWPGCNRMCAQLAFRGDVVEFDFVSIRLAKYYFTSGVRHCSLYFISIWPARKGLREQPQYSRGA